MKYVTVGGAVVFSFVHLGPASFGSTPMTSDAINAARFLDVLPEGVSELEESRNNFIASRV